jgi:hypothetical protein
MPAIGNSVLVIAIAGMILPAMGQTVTCTKCAQAHRQPYLAEFKSVFVQTLADGTTITSETRDIEALDSHGRSLLTKSVPLPGHAANEQDLQTTVYDPVGRTDGRWDSLTKTAKITKFPPEDERHGCWTTDSGSYKVNYGSARQSAPANNPDRMTGSTTLSVLTNTSSTLNGTVEEDLGTDVIQGVEVHGVRRTSTIPAGKIGNDRPIVTTNEIWTAPSLGIALRLVSDNPTSGKSTHEVVSLTVGDPDPSVFQPPEDYKVTEEELHEVPCQQKF